VVLAIFFSACVAAYEAVHGIIEPADIGHLGALAAAGALDGAHARAAAYVSHAVIASAAAVAIGVSIADPLIGLAITAVILRITWSSWRTVRGSGTHH
jgi:divalent metal cation (Fe/Co/Zn/Cd) transporter